MRGILIALCCVFTGVGAIATVNYMQVGSYPETLLCAISTMCWVYIGYRLIES